MKNYLIEWPDKSFSIISADSPEDIYRKLDKEGDPYCAKIKIIPADFHIGFTIQGQKIVMNKVDYNMKLKSYKLPRGLFDKYLGVYEKI